MSETGSKAEISVPVTHKDKNVLSPNQIVLNEHTVQPGPYRVKWYKSFVIGDTDITAKAGSYNFGHNLVDYLDRYFCWLEANQAGCRASWWLRTLQARDLPP
jgi:hypothetical protein